MSLLPASTESYVRLLLTSLRHRHGLAALETAEAGNHLIKTVVAAVCAFGLLLLTGLTLTFAIAASVWHLEERGLILGCLALLYLAIAAWLACRVKRRLRDWTPLAATRRQLGEDCELISELFQKD